MTEMIKSKPEKQNGSCESNIVYGGANMTTVNRHLGLKLIALALVVTIFATLLPQRMVFGAEKSDIPYNTNHIYSSSIW